MLIIAFALFVLLIAAWMAAPSASAARRSEHDAPSSLPAMGSHSARA